jgi:hypothetical protein
MHDNQSISDSKLIKLANDLAKEFTLSLQEAYEIIYEEWDLVETLFHTHKKTDSFKAYFLHEINTLYRIA